MNAVPCFVNGVTVKPGVACVPAQQVSGHRGVPTGSIAAGITGVGTTVASVADTWAYGSGAFFIFLGIGAATTRRRSRHSRNSRGGRTSAMQATMTVDYMAGADSKKFNYALEGSGEVSVPVCKARSQDAATSLTAYMTQPVQALSLVPLPAGVTLKYVGAKKAANGRDEQYFNLQLPPLKFPGIFTLEASATTFAKGGPSEVVIEGNEFKLMGGIGNLEEANKSVLFSMNSPLSWTDNPNERAIRVKTEVKLKINPPGMYRMILPKFLFETTGKPIMKYVLRTVQNGLAGAFAKDYERWETDQALRTSRAEKIAKMTK